MGSCKQVCAYVPTLEIHLFPIATPNF